MKTIKTTIALLSLLAIMATTAIADDTVWIDVRSRAEYEAEHLQGTTLIPHTSIRDEIGKLDLDKSAPIKLFCRSGGRAEKAKKELESMGYTKVENLGSIGHARKVKEKPES